MLVGKRAKALLSRMDDLDSRLKKLEHCLERIDELEKRLAEQPETTDRYARFRDRDGMFNYQHYKNYRAGLAGGKDE
jgi:hypothetical protein